MSGIAGTPGDTPGLSGGGGGAGRHARLERWRGERDA